MGVPEAARWQARAPRHRLRVRCARDAAGCRRACGRAGIERGVAEAEVTVEVQIEAGIEIELEIGEVEVEAPPGSRRRVIHRARAAAARESPGRTADSVSAGGGMLALAAPPKLTEDEGAASNSPRSPDVLSSRRRIPGCRLRDHGRLKRHRGRRRPAAHAGSSVGRAARPRSGATLSPKLPPGCGAEAESCARSGAEVPAASAGWGGGAGEATAAAAAVAPAAAAACAPSPRSGLQLSSTRDRPDVRARAAPLQRPPAGRLVDAQVGAAEEQAARGGHLGGESREVSDRGLASRPHAASHGALSGAAARRVRSAARRGEARL